jgi:anti-anti-sigma factor
MIHPSVEKYRETADVRPYVERACMVTVLILAGCEGPAVGPEAQSNGSCRQRCEATSKRPVAMISTESKDGILTIYFLTPRLLEHPHLEELAKEVLAQLEKTSEDRVILDFQKVQFMSSAMLGRLVMIHNKCKEYKVQLKVSSIDPEIRKVFKITKLDKLFDIEPDEAAARKDFAKHGLFG